MSPDTRDIPSERRCVLQDVGWEPAAGVLDPQRQNLIAFAEEHGHL